VPRPVRQFMEDDVVEVIKNIEDPKTSLIFSLIGLRSLRSVTGKTIRLHQCSIGVCHISCRLHLKLRWSPSTA
jgi:hypothetical protein